MKRAALFAVAVLAMWVLKRHYADARADELGWMLVPTTKLVAAATGASFELEPGAGYLCRERLFLVEKPCAGINFMIAALGMTTFVLSRRAASWGSSALIFGGAVLVSYAAAVVVNAMRITVAMSEVAHAAGSYLVGGAAWHRLVGVAVYFGGLFVLYEIVRGVAGLSPSDPALR